MSPFNVDTIIELPTKNAEPVKKPLYEGMQVKIIGWPATWSPAIVVAFTRTKVAVQLPNGDKHNFLRSMWDRKTEIIPETIKPEDPKVGLIVKMITDYGSLTGQIGKIVSIDRNTLSVQFYGKITEESNSLHKDITNTYENCRNFKTSEWRRFMEPIADQKLIMPPPVEELDKKYINIGMEIVKRMGRTYYTLPMVYAPKLLRKHTYGNDELFEIPDFLQEKLKTNVRCVLLKGSGVISLATSDMRKGFVNYHGGDPDSPFGSFCTGSLRVNINNPDDAINARDRCQTMLEVIGYDGNPPVHSINGVSIEEIREWSLIPARSRAFETNERFYGAFRILDADGRKKAMREVRQKMEDTRKKFEYIKNVIAKEEEKEKETTNA